MSAACSARNLPVLKQLLEGFRNSTCTFRSYTDLAMKGVEEGGTLELSEFTLLSHDQSISPSNRQPTEKTAYVHAHGTPSARAIFHYVAEGASRAFAGLFSASEQFMFEGGSGSSGSASVHSDILARHTSSVAAQLTQQYLNSMLIT